MSGEIEARFFLERPSKSNVWDLIWILLLLTVLVKLEQKQATLQAKNNLFKAPTFSAGYA